MNKIKAAYLIMIVFIGSSITTGWATTLQIKMQMNQGQLSGAIRDGVRLGTVTLNSNEAHTGFNIWSDQCTSPSSPLRYVLNGQQNSAFQVRVRLVPQQEMTAVVKNMSGVTVNTSDTNITFYILADGNQTVEADRYRIKINGALNT